MRQASLILVSAGAAALAASAAARGGAPAPPRSASTLIVHAVLVDGSGGARRPGAVRLRGDRVAEVGDLRAAAGETVVDARGLVLAPGFIDTHSHGDRGLFEHRDALAAVSQGITTIVAGQDGGSPWPLSEFFARLQREPAAVNVAAYAGHGRIRHEVMGADFRRAARPKSWAACASFSIVSCARARWACPRGSNTTRGSTRRRRR